MPVKVCSRDLDSITSIYGILGERMSEIWKLLLKKVDEYLDGKVVS